MIVGFQCYAQSSYRFRHFDTNDGLPSEAMSVVRQDSLGFIWTFHFDGLSSGALTRFDGFNFKVYGHNPNDSLSSPGGWIDRLETDRNGNLWIMRYAGMDRKNSFSLMKYEKETDSFKKFIPPVNGIEIYSISFEKDEPIIWLCGTNGTGLFRYNYKTNEIKNYRNTHPDPVIQQTINSPINAQSFGRFLLLATNQGTWKFDKSTAKFSRPRCDPRDSTLLYHPTTFNFVFGSPGASSLDPNDFWMVFLGQEIVRLDSNFSIKSRLKLPAGINFQMIDIDKDENIWIASTQGIYKYEPNQSSPIHIEKIEGDPYSLPTNELYDLIVDHDQNIWVATSKGISVMKKLDLTFYNHHILKSQAIGTFEADEDFLLLTKRDSVWTQEIYIAPIVPGSLDSLPLQKVPIKFPIKGGVYDFVKGEKDFWISTYWSGITRLPLNPTTGMVEPYMATQFRFDPKNPNTITSDYILGIFEEHGNLWASVFRAGINKIALNIPYGEPGSVTRYVHSAEDSNSVANNMVFRFFPADEHSFWVNNLGAIDLFRNNIFEHVSSNERNVYTIFKSYDGTTYLGATDGLYASKIGYPYKFEKVNNFEALGVHEDKLNRLWICNQQRVMMYDPKENLTIEFAEEDGISHTFENMERTTKGIIIMTDIFGVTIFDPLSLNVSTIKTYPVLTRLLINNQQVGISNRPHRVDDFVTDRDIMMLKHLVIDYRHNNFKIEFSAMEMTAPKANLYRYKLEGYDKDWNETDWKERTATYTNLDPGDYTFRVKSSNHHGVWSDIERTLIVTVLPPPWKTAWAYTGYVMLLAGILFFARRNIIQRERLKSRLKIEHLELEKAKEVNRMKTSFFTNISHEFRTPLTLIKGPAQTLLDEFSHSAKVKNSATVIKHNAETLLKLINQLLSISKLEAGGVTIEKSEVNLNVFISEIVQPFTSWALQNQVELGLELPPVNYLVSLDAEKTETILSNLISNALKFTRSHGRVKVHVSVSPEGSLKLIVSDTGIGIAKEDLEKVFQKFYQVGGNASHHEQGTGIGLSLVKDLAELLGGKVELTSVIGHGSEFAVSFPLHVIKELGEWEIGEKELLDTESMDVNVDDDNDNKPKILVVEDHAALRKFIVETLKDNYEFFEAGDGKQGLDLAVAEGPDLIISDIMMPEMDGVTMMRKIKKDLRTSHIPVILLTAKTFEESKIEALESGADDYLTKPFDQHELAIKVRNTIAVRTRLQEKFRRELIMEVPKVEAISEDERFLAKLKSVIERRLGDEHLSVDELAQEIGISRAHFYRKVTALCGQSVNNLIRDFRLQKAKQLLDQHWGSVSQIAYEVGFSSPSYFSKCFKERFGCLPSEST